jgi:glutamyl/glutaminyl-tRNA synthetase
MRIDDTIGVFKDNKIIFEGIQMKNYWEIEQKYDKINKILEFNKENKIKNNKTIKKTKSSKKNSHNDSDNDLDNDSDNISTWTSGECIQVLNLFDCNMSGVMMPLEVTLRNNDSVCL